MNGVFSAPESAPGAAPDARRWAAAVLIVIVVCVWLFAVVVPATHQITHGFVAYYTAARVIRDGLPGVRIYDEPWFLERASVLSSGRARDIFRPTPPTSAVLWLPLAALSIDTARLIWTWLNAIFLVLALWLIVRTLGIAPLSIETAALAALFTLSMPTRDQFRLGQMYAFLLLLHAVGWRAFVARSDRLAGASLGLALALKVSGWPIAFVMLISKRWQALRWAFLTALVVVASSLPFVGVDAWREYLFVSVPAVISQPQAAVPAYQTTTGFWQHLFRYDPVVNPNPIADLPALAASLTMFTIVMALWIMARRKPAAGALFAAGVVLTELLSPAAEQYHYVLVLLPLSVLAAAVVGRGQPDWRLALGWLVAAVLLAFPWPYQSERLASGWWSVLAYPRLGGGWIVWALLLVDAKRLHLPVHRPIASE